MQRFFITPNDINGKHVTFPQDVTHQICHVLRLGEGDCVTILDNSGSAYNVRLTDAATNEGMTGSIFEVFSVESEPKTRITLCFGLSSREKVEWILQKGTEVGVAAFLPFVSSRTLVTSISIALKKQQRWERIIKEAAEQAGRGLLPILHPPRVLAGCFTEIVENHDLCLLAWEDAQHGESSFKALLDHFRGNSIALCVGPEGGFSEEEVQTAQTVGCQVVSLGARILRMETAAIIFPALVLHSLGE
jgi:16S rRNA (uracil1498-N3)-methyltransferase